MENINYRIAQLNDLEAMMVIYNSTIASRMVTADTTPVLASEKVSWFWEHAPEKRPLLVVENAAGVMLGWVSFQSFYGRPAYQHTAEVSIYLATAQRGKGLGKKVLQHAIDIAPNYGIHTLLGFIFSHNTPSLQLFYAFGFEDWGVLPNVAVLDGVERSLTIVGKRLTSVIL